MISLSLLVIAIRVYKTMIGFFGFLITSLERILKSRSFNKDAHARYLNF